MKEEVYYSLECRGLFPEEQKRCCERRRGTDDVTYRSWKQGGKCNHGMDWQQKGKWYGPTNLDKRMSKIGQNIPQSHKFH